MSTQRILLLAYIVLGTLVGLALQHLFGGPVSNIHALNFLSGTVFGVDLFWGGAVGFVLAGALAVFCWFDPRVKVPATQVVEELQRVTWPSFAETKSSTIAVLVTSIICALLLGMFDYGWGAVTKAIYSEAETTSQTGQNQ